LSGPIWHIGRTVDGRRWNILASLNNGFHSPPVVLKTWGQTMFKLNLKIEMKVDIMAVLRTVMIILLILI